MEIYFDHSATTPPHPEVIDTYMRAMHTFFGNSESLHPAGVKSREILEKAREVAAEVLSVMPGEVIFTSGGTESNNLAIIGAAYANRLRGQHLITSSIEHPSVLRLFARLEKEGFDVTYLPVSREGIIPMEAVEAAVRPDTILISLMMVNNEIGSIQPVAEVGRFLQRHPKILFHVDAVQAFGKIPLRPKEWGIHLLSLSAHKFHGPKGVGLLYKEKNVRLRPLLAGGEQEFGLRPGTVNVPGIVAMVKAMRMAKETEMEFIHKVGAWKERLAESLRPIPELMIHTPKESAPHILHFTLPPFKGETILHALEAEGIYVSTRSACSGRREEMSHVLAAMGIEKARGYSGIRISLSLMNREQEIEYAEEVFRNKLLRWIYKLEDKR